MSIYKAAMITVSDKGSKGERIDTAGPACIEMLEAEGFETVFTCGGTGFSKRDVTPEAVSALFDRQAPGFAEAMRAESLKITPKAVLSRSVSGLRKESIIITLPGSKKSATENLAAVLPALKHGVEMVRSAGSANCGG